MNLKDLKQIRHDALLLAMADVLCHLSERMLASGDRKAYELNRELNLARDLYHSVCAELREREST